MTPYDRVHEQSGLVPRSGEYETGPEVVVQRPPYGRGLATGHGHDRTPYAELSNDNNATDPYRRPDVNRDGAPPYWKPDVSADNHAPETGHQGEEQPKRRRRLCGTSLTVVLVAIVAFVLGGAVGGGVGGSIAASREHRGTITTTTVLPSTIQTLPLDLVSGPTQTPCPSAKTFTPTNPVTSGNFILNSTAVSFKIYCQSDLVSIDGDGSLPRIFQEVYNTSTIQNCITACAQYNYQITGQAGYDGGIDSSEPVSGTETCDGVVWGYNNTISNNYHPTRCYLKNGVTTDMVTLSYNAHSAILLDP